MSSQDLSDGELRQQIKDLEAQGHTGTSNVKLHALNLEQTSRIPNSEIVSRIHSRAALGKPIGKLVATAKKRGLSF